MISPGCAACARLWLDDGDAFAKLGSMNLADVPDAALQGVAGIRRADFAVVALGVAHLTIKILGIENALRVLDCREESLQEDIEADISTDVLDTRVGNTGVFLPGCKMPSPLRHAVSHRSPVHSRHDAGVLDRLLLPSEGTAGVWLVASTGCRIGNYEKTEESGQ